MQISMANTGMPLQLQSFSNSEKQQQEENINLIRLFPPATSCSSFESNSFELESLSKQQENNGILQLPYNLESDSPATYEDSMSFDHFHETAIQTNGEEVVTVTAESSADIVASPKQPRKRSGLPRGGLAKSFPVKLHEMLSRVEEESMLDAISWQPHGKSFMIHDSKKFVDEVMPRYSKQSKLTSFQRQLNLYGFRRITRGPDRGGYYHEFFVKGQPDLAQNIMRQSCKVSGKGATKGEEKEESTSIAEPDFYATKTSRKKNKKKNKDNADVINPHLLQKIQSGQVKQEKIQQMKVEESDALEELEDADFMIGDLEPNQLQNMPNNSTSISTNTMDANITTNITRNNNPNLFNKISRLLSTSSSSAMPSAAASLGPQFLASLPPLNLEILNLGDLVKLKGLPFHDSDFISVLEDIKKLYTR